MQIRKNDLSELLQTSASILEQSCHRTPFAGKFNINSAAFVGDTHCAWQVSSKIISDYGETIDKIVFLGDYVDRGDTGIENLAVILKAFVKNPEKVVLLRGNHESRNVNERYGFLTEVKEKFGIKFYDIIEEFFSRLPYAAVVNDYFCVHGGIARTISTTDAIKDLPYPDIGPENRDALELLWNDPSDDIDDFSENLRGEGTFYFGQKAVGTFISKNNLKGIIRGHEVCNGFKKNLNGKVITVFSSTYHGMPPGLLIMENGNFYRKRIKT
ncbi:MAG: metallophosphoesterase [Candidatus Thermoplasmatota archaeon]|nr:metallophosphoesterase [Candidatus Thermoplasmatota archaeon]